MKNLLIVVAFLFFGPPAFTQVRNPHEKGNSTISAGYGIGYRWNKRFEANGGNSKVSSTGPFSLTYEYGLSAIFSIGLTLAYSDIKGNYENGFGSLYSQSFRNVSAIVIGNYHFGEYGKFDPYMGIGAGFHNYKYVNSGSSQSFTVPSAFGYSLQLGTKYYIAPAFGVFAEVGYVASSYGRIGITARF